MAFDIKDDPTLQNVIAGLPRVAELIATVPETRRTQALEAAEQSYIRTARALGYDEAAADDWAAAVMSHLRLRKREES
jgi:hypothetical protein